MLHLPRVMFAAPSSGSGKTMITCGILEAFLKRGMRPASFKCGPDYIDPMFHTKVIGTPSRNLDTFFTDRDLTRFLFARSAREAGISVFEGVMGIYDGLGGISAKASSYDLAAATDTPVILVVNARGMSLSVIPMICGYLDYQKRLGAPVIRGVILNQMTKMTYLLLKDEIEKQTGVRLYGYVPRLTDAAVESRHLGLVTPGEIADLKERLERLGEALEECLDLDGIRALAESAKDYREEEAALPEIIESSRIKAPVRIAVARDEAFCFYYQDNLDLLKLLGAELVSFSPLRDSSLPEGIGGLILGGGYPELYAGTISDNSRMRDAIRSAVDKGMPCLAECGGFMYLHETMEDMDGHTWPMCGCIRGRSYRTPRLTRFGYVTLSVREEDSGKEAEGGGKGFLRKGETIRAHEFHYFDSTDAGKDYTAKKPAGRRTWDCIHATDHSTVGYPHLYYWSHPEFAVRFLEAGERYAGREEQVFCSGRTLAGAV